MSGVGYERRKQVRVEMRRDLVVGAQEYRGQTYYVLKDPVRLRYFRLKEREYFLVSRLDGRHTLEDVRVAVERRYRPVRVRLEEVEAFARQLITDGLAHPAAVRASEQLLKRRRQFQNQQRRNLLVNLLSLRVPLCDPDRHLGRLAHLLRGILSRAFLVIGTVFILAALLLVTVHFGQLHARLPGAGEFFRLRTVFYLWAAVAVAKVLHELGHGLSCKAFGGEVHEMGLMLLCLAPCLYCDVSDAWTFPSKWRRMFVGFAGMYVELLLAAVATFVWWYTPDTLLINRLCLGLMIVCSINTLTLNGNPLLRYDGYYILADYLEITNLHGRSREALLEVAMSAGLGIPVREETRHAPMQRLGLAAFAAASIVYRWVVSIGMVWFLYQFLKPYRLAGSLVPLAIAATLIGATVGMYRTVVAARQRGRFTEMKPARCILAGSGLLMLLTGLFLLPLPIGHLRKTGLLAFHEDAAVAVRPAVPGVLARVYVREGQRVEAGELLAEFHNRELEDAYAEEQAADSVRAVQRSLLAGAEQPSLESNAEARAAMRVVLAASEQNRGAHRTAHYRQLLNRLQLRAPRAGVVIGLPDAREIGRLWSASEEKPFCIIGDPGRLCVTVPLTASELRRLREDQEQHVATQMVMAVPGCPGMRPACRILQVPQAEAESVPSALAAPLGGPVEVRADGAERPRPVTPQFLVKAEVLQTKPAAGPGMLVPVVIRCRWQTGATWLWEMFSGSVGMKMF